MASGIVKQNSHVTAEDQEMINRFARLYQKSLDVKEKLQEMNSDLQNLNDATDEMVLLEEAGTIPFQIGSVFMHTDHEKLCKTLENMRSELENKVIDLTEKYEKICDEMNSLKLILYGKFGDSINLETDMDNQ
ncbi:Uncharacterized protein BM_BM13904 [Brugia malayi]|nr:Uncharacterized protein BM_BM13904 [Brugia malayi]VDO31045.1 unnamed protein product [Brugia timori]VIO87364.1 Uncharacterized protein BM_BM13904 [Brugia malayi]